MTEDHKAVLLRYLRSARAAVTWKLEGLSDHDVRRPLTPTGTNLLGVVKHLAGVEAGYFGDCLGRPVPDLPAWYAEMMADTLEDNGDMWAMAEESRESILDLYERVAAHTAAATATTTVSLGIGGKTLSSSISRKTPTPTRVIA